ncbi:hypothetical protein EAO28_03740 [Klebsiella pneumoniae]|uniref:Uncharacterized protein n=1 Tax=Klebsiella pneumoniae TaxID=573 RepID=A0A3P2EGW7_KLEPN|nr:hypothetical protein EAO28_03740 [Klebsiella pneumoniae]
MEKLNNQGIQLNATFIDQIVTLQRQGRESEATALLQKQAMAELEKQIKDQEDKVDGLKGAWKSLKDYVSSAFKTMGDAQMGPGAGVSIGNKPDTQPGPGDKTARRGGKAAEGAREAAERYS